MWRTDVASDNRMNPAKGRWFQDRAAVVLSKRFGIEFRSD